MNFKDLIRLMQEDQQSDLVNPSGVNDLLISPPFHLIRLVDPLTIFYSSPLMNYEFQ